MLFSNLKNYSRFQASGIHFLFSLGILIVLLGLMIGLWFPGETFLYDGGLQGLKILIPVDLVLGPVLTLVVFNTKKKSLKTDLTLIALVQVLALSWGVSQIYTIRSQFIVYYDNTFTSVTREDLITYQKIIKDKEESEIILPLKSWYEKTSIVTLTPTDNEEAEATRKNRIELGRSFGTGGPTYNHELYIDIDSSQLDPEKTYNGFFRHFETSVKYDTSHQKLYSIATKEKIHWLDLLLVQ